MRKSKWLWLAVVVLLVLCSCATYSAQKAYLAASEQYNAEVTRYLKYYDSARPEQRANYRHRIDPYVIRAGEALDLWGAALTLKNGDGTELSSYLDAKNAMIDALAELYGEKVPAITVDPKE